MSAAIVVVGFDNVGSTRSEKPLVATRRSQVLIIARILGNFDVPLSVGSRGQTDGILTQSEIQIVTVV